MKNLNSMSCALLASIVLGGCGAQDGAADESDAGDAIASTELARIEFEDGNVVRFEALYGGMFVSELGSELNRRHLVPKEGQTALKTFEDLAPGRTVPAALRAVHDRMYPPGARLEEGRAAGATPESEETEVDPDLEHSGEFQQSFPAANFLAQMCDFTTTSPSYKHTNRTNAHTDVSLNIHAGYYAAGSDLGIITEQACAGKSDSQGNFVGQCNAQTAVQAGFAISGLYDAGERCETACGPFGQGCVTVCAPRKVRFDLRHGKISSNVNFHECAKLTR